MDVKKFLPHIISVIILLAVAAFFFAPNAFSGKVLPQGDNQKALGMQAELREYEKKDGRMPLWTNSAFSGMPAYQVNMTVNGNLTNPVGRALFLWGDYTSLWKLAFTAMFCMYLLLLVLRIDWRVALFGAVAFGITTYNVDILEAGHTTKMRALALAPGVLAGLAVLLNGRWLLGGGLLALFLALQINANHVQITYYTLLLAGIFFLADLAQSIRHKALLHWGRNVAVGALAIGLAFASNLSRLWPTYEYGQETIRGRSELSQRAGKGDGLDVDYLFGWSYGKAESFTLIVPHYAGGGAGETFRDTRLYKAVDPQARGQISSIFYTGDQPFLGTAIYFGAIVCFLFLLGAFVATGPVKWALLGGGLFFLSLAWGKNFGLNFVWLEVLPMFNKFRAVSMALGVAQLCFAALAALGLQKMFDADISTQRKRRALLIAGGGALVLCLAAFLTGDTAGANDQVLAQNPQLLGLLKADRADLVRSDVMRSLAFIGLSFGLLWFALKGRLGAGLTVGAIALLALADHWMVAARTLTPEKYETKRAVTATPPEQPFDKQIKQDPDPHYRVLDLARGSITGNATTSYFHKSMSGYHAAKLQRYQEVVDTFLTAGLGNNLHIVGMLNGKYIVSQKGEVIANPEALGNAWFVRHVDIVPSADAELAALGDLNPRDTAVVQEAQAGALEGFRPQFDSTARIRLTSYHPDRLEYEYSAASEQLAVFSEIYYTPAKGWKTFINGQPAPDFFKVNYLLRGMRLPAGQNVKLEMRFEPRSYYLGETISTVASLLVLALFIAGMVFYFRRARLEEPGRLDPVEPEPNVRPRKAATPLEKRADAETTSATRPRPGPEKRKAGDRRKK